ncbi:C-type lectin 37Db-like [Anopheles moucheti]|uniref:C-type lectin 37Db-like n=1 Tax=Anopheles moucheti TaxID=186751 RepID=UPI0022F11F9A|nr:C-type lectin 37Db-like [Anopheles moucheti]
MKRSFVTTIVAVLTVSFAQFQISAIGHDAISFRVLQQKSYYFGNIFKLNWHKASAFCRSQGLFLVSIKNQAQLDEVIGYVRKIGYFLTEETLQLWTSGNDLEEKNQYIWTSTGERITLNRWSVGEPNHMKEDDCIIEQCVVLQHYEPPASGRANYSLDDRACYREYYFLCESLDG